MGDAELLGAVVYSACRVGLVKSFDAGASRRGWSLFDLV
jgi:hypothetical protein